MTDISGFNIVDKEAPCTLLQCGNWCGCRSIMSTQPVTLLN